MTSANGSFALSGFTDSYAVTDSIALQSLAVTAIDTVANVAVVLAGSLDLSSSALTLTQFTNQSTESSETWIQTKLNQYIFAQS